MFLRDVKIYEDVYFVVSALSLAERVGKIPEVLIHHRIYTDQARSKMFRKHYSQVPGVYLEMKKFLEHNGMYAPLSTSFLNLTASRCYRVYNVLGWDDKEKFWNLLHNKYVDTLGWQGRETDDFEEKDVCEFVANIILYTHDQYKKRLDKGYQLDFEKLTAAFRNNKTKKRFGAFFKSLFLRKEKAEK